MSGDHNMNQKPVAWFHEEKYKTHFTTNPSEDMIGKYWQPLYTAPRQWQRLTDEDVKSIWCDIDGSEGLLMRFARAIEAKLRERNS